MDTPSTTTPSRRRTIGVTLTSLAVLGGLVLTATQSVLADNRPSPRAPRRHRTPHTRARVNPRPERVNG